MAKLTDKLRQLVKIVNPQDADPETLVLDESAVTRLMQLLADEETAEFSCEATFNLLDEYVEIVASDEEAAALMPVVQHHLEKCDGCHTRFEILLDILKNESKTT